MNDNEWFRANRNSNVRLRLPRAGEVEELARRFGAGAYYELAMAGGILPPPTPDVEWQIMIIKAHTDMHIRLLTMRNAGAGDEMPEFSCYAVAAFNRVAVDRR